MKIEISIGNAKVGDDNPCYVVAEIGINHNGNIEIAKKLIDVAVKAGCNAVKFQKRTPDLCVPENQKKQMRETPWGYITYLEYRYKVEFGEAEYSEIDHYCKQVGIVWFASGWDEASVNFLETFNPVCYKIASASLTDDDLLHCIRSQGRPIVLSTGMTTLEQIDHAVEILGKDNLILLHTCSTYPANYDELNLRIIPALKKRYGIPIGYSGHETGLPTTTAAVALGACMIERHITLDRSMWGSDQAASLEPNGITRLVRDIRLIETAFGDGIKRIGEREKPIIQRLRRVDTMGNISKK